MSEVLRLGIAGLGTVGAGVVKILTARGAHLSAATGRSIAISAVSARDRKKDRGIDLSGIRWEDDPLALARADDVDVVVELIGGSEGVARDLVEAALRAGKHVVTANKALVAHHGGSLARLAEAKGVALNYEAAVAGGIPIVKTMREALAANDRSLRDRIRSGYDRNQRRDRRRQVAGSRCAGDGLGWARRFGDHTPWPNTR